MAAGDVVDIRLSATDNFSSTMGKMARSMDVLIGKHTAMAVAVVATAAVVTSSVGAYAKFERQLAKVNTMLAQGEERFLPGYAREMKRLAAISGQSTATLADGLYDILSASRGAEGAIKILAATTGAAIAGFTDVSVATAGALTTLNAFKFANEEIESILDKQFATVKRGRLTYEEYANTIGTLAATSALAGQSLESMNAAVATVTRGGISAERAIVAINGAMLAFLKPTSGAAKAAKEYGIELNMNAIQGDNLAKTLDRLKTLRADELAQIFVERRAFKAISVLTQNYAGFVRDLGEQHNAAGEKARAQKKAEDTLNFQTERSVEIFKNAGRAIGEFFTPALKGALKAINDSIDRTDVYLEKIDGIKSRSERQARGGKSLSWLDIREEIRVTQKELDRLDKWARRPFPIQFIFGGLTPGVIATETSKMKTRMDALQKASSEMLDTQIARQNKLQDNFKANNKGYQESLRLRREIAALNIKEIAAAPIQGPAMQRGLADAIATTNKMREDGVFKTTEMLRAETALKKQVEAGTIAAKARNEEVAKRLKLYKAIEVLRQKGAELRAERGKQPERTGLFGSTSDMKEEEITPSKMLKAQVVLGQAIHEATMRRKEAERLAHEEMLDGMLTKDQSYWSSVSELMRSTYDKQATMANIAATQSVAFIERSFSALENELMKSKASSKALLRALETEAKRGVIRAGLDFVKNELKSIFIVEKAKNSSDIKTATIAKALRREAYISEMVQTGARVFGNTFSAIAAIPFVGPFLAPGAAATAQATVTAAMAPAAAAHGGIDDIPGYLHNQTFILSAGERVVQPEANVKLTRAVEMIISGEAGGLSAAAQALTAIIPLHLDGEILKTFIVNTVTEGTRDGDIILDKRAVTT